MNLPHLLRLPRNYNFISQLPEYFDVQVLAKQNKITEGTWYLCVVGEHELNLLSQVNLEEGNIYTIRKKDHMTLELHDKKLRANHSKVEDGINFLR
ncbi:MAG: hypothetical protein OEV78_05885 [Spirochaetia bacterium]|nr:hypothetical protein [Spirochaetia bacterium]